LFGIAALQLVFGLVAVTLIPEQLAGGPVPPQAIPIMAAIVVAIALAYAGLGWWASYQPLPAAVTGLVLYLVVLLLDFLSNPALVTRGIYIKIAIIAALIKAVQSAAKIDSRWKPEALDRFQGQRGPAPWTTPWGEVERRSDPANEPCPRSEARVSATLAGPGPLAATDIREGSPPGREQRSDPIPRSGEVLPSAAQREIAEELWKRLRAQEERPWWVQVGLWRIQSRSTAWAFFWFSLVLAVAPGLFLFTLNKGFVLFGLFGLAALWYWLCIRWVDEHGAWS
jgi:hypothetical protein